MKQTKCFSADAFFALDALKRASVTRWQFDDNHFEREHFPFFTIWSSQVLAVAPFLLAANVGYRRAMHRPKTFRSTR